MPEYLPTPSLPTGMAEELIRMRAQKNDPWAALAQSLGKTAGGVAEAAGERSAQTKQAQAALQFAISQGYVKPEMMGPRLPPSPNGMPQQGPPQPIPTMQAFPKGMPGGTQTLGELMHAKTQEDIARETTTRMMGVAGARGDEQFKSTHTTYTPEQWSKMSPENRKKLEGLGASAGIPIPNQMLTAILKPPSSQQANAATPEEEKSLREQAKLHPDWYPSDIFKSRGPQYKFLANQALTNPGVDPRKANIEYGAAKAGATAAARFDESGPGQMVARVANSAMEQLDALQKASDNFPRSDVQMLNTPIMKIDEQTMPEAQDWKIALNTARMEYATALNRGNSPGLENIAEATKALPDTITMKQLPSAIKQLRLGLTNTVKGMTTRIKPSSDKPSSGGSKSASDYVDSLGLGNG